MPNLIDPNEVLDYTCDWSTFLDDGGSPSDTIDTSAWEITPIDDGSPTSPVLTSQTNTTNSTTVFGSNAVYGQVYRLTNRIVTSSGRTADRSWTLQCEHR